LSAFLLIFLITGCSRDETYPNRPITLVCPWSVGGGTDLCSRQMAHFLKEELGTPVNVINATGGRGVTGLSRSLNSRPDGYTVGTITLELNMLHWQGLTNLTYEDAELLFSFNEDAAAIFVPFDSPMNSMQDLMDEIVKNPGKLTVSGSAMGAAWHLAMVGWLESAGRSNTDIKWVPMGGAGPSLQELASSGLDMVCCSLPETEALYRAKRIKCLGVMSEERAPGYEDVKTLKEQGFDWSLVGWRGLAVPKGTPPERVDRLTKAIERVVKGETVIEGKTFPDFMATKHFNNKWRKRGDFKDFLKDNNEKLGKMLTGDAFQSMSKSPIHSMFFPYIILSIIGILLFILGTKTALAIDHAPSEAGKDKEIIVAEGGIINASLVFGGIICYLFFAEEVGFILMAAAILFILLWRLGTRLSVSVLITIVFVPGLYLIFTQLLKVPLPIGILG
jgi:putative tricarboxylic transport membrane protein